MKVDFTSVSQWQSIHCECGRLWILNSETVNKFNIPSWMSFLNQTYWLDISKMWIQHLLDTGARFDIILTEQKKKHSSCLLWYFCNVS